MSQPLVELVDAWICGDQRAAAGIVERFKGRVFGLCMRMLRHQQDAEDTAQETFVRALKSVRQWDQARPFEPWLMAIAANRCRTLLSKRARRPMTTELLDHVPEHRDDLSRAKHLSEEVNRALDGLREDYRQAFCLFHEHHLSYEDIAKVCDRPLGTVKTWIHRARREIAQALIDRQVVEPVEVGQGNENAVRADSY